MATNTSTKKTDRLEAVDTIDLPEAKETPFEQVSDLMAELAQTHFDETVDATRALFAARDARTAFEVQSNYLTGTFKRNMDGMRRLNDLAGEALRTNMIPVAMRWAEQAFQVSKTKIRSN